MRIPEAMYVQIHDGTETCSDFNMSLTLGKFGVESRWSR